MMQILLFIFPVILIILTLISHNIYLRNTAKMIRSTSDPDFLAKDLTECLSRPQGSNFNTMALVSWILLAPCIAFLFFLTPRLFEQSLLGFGEIASNYMNLWLLTIIIIIILLPISILMMRIYRFHNVNKVNKLMIFYIVPPLMFISLLLSSYLSTIYPIFDQIAWNFSYSLMIIGEILLFLPIYKNFSWRLER
jgi:hypothetical protein